MTQPELFDPAAPYVRTSETSRLAAEQIQHRTHIDRERILAYVRATYGATDNEIQAALFMDGNTERPRRVELVNEGKLVAAGRRKTGTGRLATIWRVP